MSGARKKGRFSTSASVFGADSVLAVGRFVLAFLLPLALYLSTVAPTVYNLDSAELTTAAYTGGLLRATGYPLYLILGKLWSQLPIGDVGYRMNVFSAIFGALTLAIADLVLRQLAIAGWAPRSTPCTPS